MSITFLASVTPHMVIAVTFGYKSIYLSPAPLLVSAFVLLISKSLIDKQFRRQGCGFRLVTSMLASIFPIISKLPSRGASSEEQDNGQTRFMARVKSTGSEFGFVYVLHALNILVGTVSYTVLMQTDENFVVTIEKVEQACGISFAVLIYVVCPVCLLVSLLSTLLRQCL